MGKIFITLRVAMEYGSLHGGCIGLREFPIGGGKIEDGAITRRKPALGGFSANQANGAVECFAVLGSAHQRSAQRDGASPILEESRAVIYGPFKGRLIDDRTGLG